MATSKKDEARQEQFPSLVGEPEVEIQERNPDADPEDSPIWNYLKDFVVRKEDYVDSPELHEANEAAARQEAINNGAHPIGVCTFDGVEDHEDGVSLYLHYSVKCLPAVIADDPESQHPTVQNPED